MPHECKAPQLDEHETSTQTTAMKRSRAGSTGSAVTAAAAALARTKLYDSHAERTCGRSLKVTLPVSTQPRKRSLRAIARKCARGAELEFTVAEELGCGEQGCAYALANEARYVLKATPLTDAAVAEAWRKESVIACEVGAAGLGPAVPLTLECSGFGFIVMERLRDAQALADGTLVREYDAACDRKARGWRECCPKVDHVTRMPLRTQEAFVDVLARLLALGFVHMDNHLENLGYIRAGDPPKRPRADARKSARRSSTSSSSAGQSAVVQAFAQLGDAAEQPCVFDFGFTQRRDLTAGDLPWALAFSVAQVLQAAPVAGMESTAFFRSFVACFGERGDLKTAGRRRSGGDFAGPAPFSVDVSASASPRMTLADLALRFPRVGAATAAKARVALFVARALAGDGGVSPQNMDLYVGTCCYAQILGLPDNERDGHFLDVIYSIRQGTWSAAEALVDAARSAPPPRALSASLAAPRASISHVRHDETCSRTRRKKA